MVGGNSNVAEMYLSMFGCKNCMLPMMYLGMPISKIGIWVLSMLGMLKKINAWQGDAASSGGRLVLVASSISSVILCTIE
jgi:hypothetical protein